MAELVREGREGVALPSGRPAEQAEAAPSAAPASLHGY
jgi:hypothetical protein